MFSSTSFANEIVGKSMKCETKKETIRGYPFYFFFEDLDNVQSFAHYLNPQKKSKMDNP